LKHETWAGFEFLTGTSTCDQIDEFGS